MVELEWCGPPPPAHECPNPRPAVGIEAIGVGAVDGFAGDFGLYRVEHLVRVHRDEVQAITALASARCQRRDVRCGEDIVSRGRGSIAQLLEMALQLVVGARGDRRQHGLDLVQQRLDQAAGTRNAEVVRAFKRTRGCDFIARLVFIRTWQIPMTAL